MARLELAIENKVAYISFNDPKHANAFDQMLERDLYSMLTECRYNEEVYVIVLRAEGKMFSAGGNMADLKLAVDDPVGQQSVIDETMVMPGSISKLIRAIEKPVVAAVNGAVAGAAESIVLMCDFRIADADAMFVTPFVNIGLIPDGGGIYAASRIMGAAKAAEMAMLGRPIKADQALQLGLVTKVVSPDELVEATRKFAEKLAAGPRLVYKWSKALINQACYSDIESNLNNESIVQNICIRSQDCKEGVYAFLEKRRPEFCGK